MNQPDDQPSQSQLPSPLSEKELLVAHLMGLPLEQDRLNQIPASRRAALEDEILAELQTPVSARPKPKSTPVIASAGKLMPSPLNRGLLALTSCLLIVLIGTLIVEAVNAAQQKRRQLDYARRLMEFSLDIYDQDLQKMARLAIEAELQLPESGRSVFESAGGQQVKACCDSLQALMLVRLGSPALGLQQLQQSLAEVDARGQVPSDHELEVMRQLLVGKTCLEASELFNNRSLLSIDKQLSSISEQAHAAVKRSCELVQRADNPFANNTQKILIAALSIDLARSLLKGAAGPQDIDERFELMDNYFDNATLALQQSAAELEGNVSRHWFVQKHRLIHNLILRQSRRFKFGPPFDQQTFTKLVDEHLAELKFAKQLRLEQTKARSVDVAVNFEQAICYLNLADFVDLAVQYDVIERTDPLVNLSFGFRAEAELLLQAIPHLSRTERCRENRAIGLVRDVRVRIQLAVDRGTLEKELSALAAMASKAHFVLEDILDSKIGQLEPSRTTLVAALVPEFYSDKAIEQALEPLRQEPIYDSVLNECDRLLAAIRAAQSRNP